MPSPKQQKPPLILLVEEEATERVAIARHLQDAGFAVLEAADSDAAMAFLKERSDLGGLVTDAHVPGQIDGFELARLVRERWPDIAVVMTSGHSDHTSGPVPEGSEFVAKPYLLSQLAPALERLIGRDR